MAYRQLPPVAAVVSFIDCINRGDVDGLGMLMTDDHELVVFDEETLRGKTPNVKAWKGYAAAFPPYVIYPRTITEPCDGWVAMLGYTTGFAPRADGSGGARAVRHLACGGAERAAVPLALA